MQTVLFIEGTSHEAWPRPRGPAPERERERGIGPIDRLARRANRAIGWNFPFDLRYSAAADKRPRIQQVEVSSQSSGSETSLESRPRVPMPLPYLTLLLHPMRQKGGHVFARVLLRGKFIVSFSVRTSVLYTGRPRSYGARVAAISRAIKGKRGTKFRANRILQELFQAETDNSLSLALVLRKSKLNEKLILKWSNKHSSLWLLTKNTKNKMSKQHNKKLNRIVSRTINKFNIFSYFRDKYVAWICVHDSFLLIISQTRTLLEIRNLQQVIPFYVSVYNFSSSI